MRSQSPDTAPPIVAIVVPVVVIVVLVTIVIVAVVIYKKTQFGYWKLFHKWVPNKESVSRLHVLSMAIVLPPIFIQL